MHTCSIEAITEHKNNCFNINTFIEFLLKQGIIVKTNTKARGNLGIYFKNRIDISKNAKNEKRISILAHEYAHKIHYDLENGSIKDGGHLEILFNTDQTQQIKNELFNVTCLIDPTALFEDFYKRKNQIFQQIMELENTIRQEYPDFKRSNLFEAAKRYFKVHKTPAQYLLKYSRIKIISPVFKKEEYYSINNIEKDFPELPCSIIAYIKLKGLEFFKNLRIN